MCNRIVINKDEKEIETPAEFYEHFGFNAFKEEHHNTIIMDACLCQVDVDKSLKEHNVEFKKDEIGDYYIDSKNLNK